MDAIWVVILSTVVPALIVLAGRWLDRRRGVPGAIDSAIDAHVQFVVDALNDEIELRKKAETKCLEELQLQRDERVKERDAHAARIDALEHDKDLLQAQVNRLLARVNGDVSDLGNS